MDIQDIISEVSALLWGWPMIILLFGTHIFLTIRLRFPQRKIFTAIKLSVAKDNDGDGDVSPFGSLATALAATIGTGNIVGVATAIALGGPGAVLWCWLTGIFGIATKYAEGVLAIKYRQVTADGNMLGGPMYALEKGLGWKWASIFFALFTVLASLGIGSSVQSNAITALSAESLEIPKWIIGLVICSCATAVIVGGVKSIAKACTMIVPFMAVLYVLGCIVILIINHDYFIPAISTIVKSAFNPAAAGGGFVGTSIMMTARYGIARGLFSNESGLGSAPIVAAAAKARNPVRQALISSSGTFWDTVIICAMTGIVIVSSMLANPDMTWNNGGTLTHQAFENIPYIGSPLLTFGLVAFAFSTILGWFYYGEKAMEYLGGKKIGRFYRFIFLGMVFIGSVIDLNVVWNLADIFNALMAIPNLISLLLLNGIIVHETRKYLWRDRLDRE